MIKNKFTPFVLGGIAITVALVVVFIQYNVKKQESYNTAIETANLKTTEYTLAQVATHKTPSDCWTTINGGVYDVTPWISKHPGGAEAIVSLCGIDGSLGFNGQHGGERRPATELASFKIGNLK